MTLTARLNQTRIVPHPHQWREGSREHVIWWSNLGRHCSEPSCEINERASARRQPRWLDRAGKDLTGYIGGGDAA